MMIALLKAAGRWSGILTIIVLVIALLRQLIALVSFLLVAIKIGIVVLFVGLMLLIVLSILRSRGRHRRGEVEDI